MGAAAAFALASCGSHGRSITLDREVLIGGVEPHVDAIARTRDDGFIVTGFGTTGWVIATDKLGSVRWRFVDPIDAGIDRGRQADPQTEFHGVVPLANGNTLLCGGKNQNGHTQSLMVILDGAGAVVERRLQAPNGDARFIHSNFYQCFPWQDRVLLLGNANDGTHGFIWLVELDGKGVKQHESFVDAVPLEKTRGASPGFVFTAWDSNDKLRIMRINAQGETLAKRVIAGEFIVKLRSVADSSRTSLIIYQAGAETLYTLDEHLRDARPPSAIVNFDVLAGCGYVLGDGSIVLFGRRPNAAVAWVAPDAKTDTLHSFDSKFISATVNDAVPIATDQFVTVRGGAGENPGEQGLVMSWVTIR